jgi:Protein of unknown function (DUF1501)
VIRRRDFLSSVALPFLGMKNTAPGRSCILLRLNGGSSQLDTWDMKPDAPSEIRGPFRPIRTNVPGIEISEIFPRMARHAHQYAIIRSVHHTALTHEEAEKLFGLPPARSVFEGIDWDAHGWGPFNPVSSYREVAGARFDREFCSLLESGLLENNVVVAMGEFGRTPKINPDGGRDHWPHCFSIVMAGAGIRGGQVYGSSDRIGAEPRDNPVTPAMIMATIRRAIGLAPGSQPIEALLA